MNRDTIRRTALSRFDPVEGVFVVESPLFDRVIGVADTEEAAHKVFNELLDDAYIAYLEGRLAGYDKPGRPAKNLVSMHIQVKPTTKLALTQMAKKLGTSQGETVEYLFHFHRCKSPRDESSATKAGSRARKRVS